METVAIFWHWVEFALRWLHVIVGIAWIGSSFYFIALDLGLRRPSDLPQGVSGEEWQVHGGGFYHVQKYLVAPDRLPEHLIWFKWESYSTWLSGFALLAVVYWLGAEFYLIDPGKMDLSLWQAIAISAGSLALGWVIYDALCKSPLGAHPMALMLVLFAALLAMGWAYDQVFTGRAALLHLGAFTATIMSGNVFFIIMPNQRIVVADMKAGRVPDGKYGKIAKLRSTHNNYLTLPVIFLMLSNHYPLAIGAQYTWAIAGLVFLMGVTIRHYFNTLHATGRGPHWTWAATVVLFLCVIWISTQRSAVADAVTLTPTQTRFVEASGFAAVHDIVLGRCSMCHAAKPAWDGLYWPPKQVVLESEADIARHARAIYLQAGLSHAMPPANLSYMEETERRAIIAWYLDAQR
ncbi:MAG: urate hydroxylase PuuD [Pseudomonadota bacterium]